MMTDMIPELPQLIGESTAWLASQEHVSRLAPLNRPCLIIGERGTGKELVGARIHYLSRRWEKPYVKVNCAALSEDLLDSELFGHERGAFTGAVEHRSGHFEQADGGTLFLDEIATASQRVQEKLLRVVEYGEFQRLGGQKLRHTDVRVIAATNVDLPARARAGTFRADLLDRLAFDVVTLPPLRARSGDIALLAEHFARLMAREMKVDFPGFAPSALVAMEAEPWPGNVRELRNFTQRMTCRALSEGQSGPIVFDPASIDPFASPFRPADQQSVATHDRTLSGSDQKPSAAPIETIAKGLTLREQVHHLETRLIDEALSVHDGHQGKAARHLGLTYHQFRALLKKHGYGKPARERG